MDLTPLLLRLAARRPHVLVVPAVGGTAARLAVEAALARRNWPTAIAPGDADILVVAGSPGPELAAVVDRIWQHVPAPRARVAVRDAVDAERVLDDAVALVADPDHQRTEAASPEVDQARARPSAAGSGPHHARAEHDRHSEPTGHAQPSGHHEHAHEGADVEHRRPHDAGHDHAGHESRNGPGDHHGGHGDHGGHGGHGAHHGHHGHGGGTELPGGLPMADLGEDRDGLTLDRLHVPLGPVLPDWPAGLVVRVTLQGDVIQVAAAEVLDAARGGSPGWRDGDVAARELDALARFLGVAGWADAAARSRRLRDALLRRDPAGDVRAPVEALVRRVRRSRTLRWLVRGIPAGGTDVAGLLERRLAVVEGAIRSDVRPLVRPTVEELAGLLVGAELAAARLIVAATDPDTEPVRVPDGARHG